MKIRNVIMYFALLLILCSCRKTPSFELTEISEKYSSPQLVAWFEVFSEDLIPIQDTYNSLWGFMNSKGEIIIEVEYQDYLPINQNEGITVKKDGNWGIIDFAGNELIPFSYKNIPIISEGLVRLHNNDTDKFGFTDISNPQIKSYDYDMAYAYSEGVSMVMKNEKWGGLIRVIM